MFYLNRYRSSVNGILGYISDDKGVVLCQTCELPWQENEPDKSCIPSGTYNVIRHNSTAHPHSWELTDVPGRTGILIHNGNTENDSKGCILVGSGTGVINGLPAVLNSNATLQKLQEKLPDSFTLTVQWL